jgi:hypothetical protein
MIIAGGDSIIEVSGLAAEVDLNKFPKETVIERFNNTDPWVSWGDDNLLPNRIITEIGKDEVVFRSNEFNKSTHLGLGLDYCIEKKTTDGRVREYQSIPEIDDWMEANDAQTLMLEFIEDFESLGNIVPAMVLSKNRKEIARILRKKSLWSRFEKQDASSRQVKNLYYNADWENYKADYTVKIPCLNVDFPVDDLLAKTSGFEFIYRRKPIAANRYYYDMANVEVLINSGSFDIRDMLKGFYKSRLKNGLGAAFHIKVTESYLKTRVKPDEIKKLETDPSFRRSILQAIKTEVDTWLAGPDNGGKIVITTRFKEQLKTGYEYVDGITIDKIDTSLQLDGWLPNIQQIQAQSFLAMGVDPSTIGLSNAKDGMNSGSEKKNAFYNTQATLHIDRLNTLAPFYFAARFNGWTKKYPGLKWILDDQPEIAHGNDSKKTKSPANAS